MEKYSLQEGKKYKLDDCQAYLLEEIRIGRYRAIHPDEMDEEMLQFYKQEVADYEAAQEQWMIDQAEIQQDPDYWEYQYRQYLDTLDQEQIEVVEEMIQQSTTSRTDSFHYDFTGSQYDSDQFKIQIATEIVRDNQLDQIAFVLYVHLIKEWNIQRKPDSFVIDRKKICMFMNTTDRTLKKYYNQLFKRGYVLNEIEYLKRNGSLEVQINKRYDPQSQKGIYFTQLTHNVINKYVLDKIDYIGIRMLYYYASYINIKQGKTYAYPEIEHTMRDIGVCRNTVNEGNKLLEDVNFIDIARSTLHNDGEYRDDRIVWQKWNNKYYIKQKKIDKFVERKMKKKAQ